MLGRARGERNKRGFAPRNVDSGCGPRTRFRYPGQVSGPADEEICLVRGVGRREAVVCGGCYRGLQASARTGGRVGEGDGGLVTTHFAGLDRKRTRSS